MNAAIWLKADIDESHIRLTPNSWWYRRSTDIASLPQMWRFALANTANRNLKFTNVVLLLSELPLYIPTFGLSAGQSHLLEAILTVCSVTA
jgi:hypothetical protein